MRAASAMSAFTNQTGRVIALGRAMLALLFLLTIWLDASQPTQFEAETYGSLIFYVVFALAILALTCLPLGFRARPRTSRGLPGWRLRAPARAVTFSAIRWYVGRPGGRFMRRAAINAS